MKQELCTNAVCSEHDGKEPTYFLITHTAVTNTCVSGCRGPYVYNGRGPYVHTYIHVYNGRGPYVRTYMRTSVEFHLCIHVYISRGSYAVKHINIFGVL